MRSKTYWRVRFLMAAGHDLTTIPVDLVARLSAEGHDLDDMQQRYAR